MANPTPQAGKQHLQGRGSVILVAHHRGSLVHLQSCSGDKCQSNPAAASPISPPLWAAGMRLTRMRSSALNKQVEEGYINISMNTSPVFKRIHQHLMIINGASPAIADCEINRDDTGEEF